METAILEELGLNKKEAEIYINLLIEGSSTATKISRSTKIERTLVYRILEKLIDRGIVNYKIENKVKKFNAVNPERLLIELKEKEKRLKSYLLKLKGITKQKEKEPNIEIYKGLNGIRGLARETLRLKQDYDVISTEIKSQSMHYFFELFMKEIEKADIHERVLVTEGMKITFKSKNTRIRYLPKGYKYKTTTGISGDNVALILWSEPFLTVVIKDKNLADTYRSYFEILWKMAKK